MCGRTLTSPSQDIIMDNATHTQLQDRVPVSLAELNDVHLSSLCAQSMHPKYLNHDSRLYVKDCNCMQLQHTFGVMNQALPCRTSVAVLKSRMQAEPMMQSTLLPANFSSHFGSAAPTWQILATPAWNHGIDTGRVQTLHVVRDDACACLKPVRDKVTALP